MVKAELELPRTARRKPEMGALFEPVEMSQAAPYQPPIPAPDGATYPPKRRRTRLLIVPLGIVLLFIAIPGAAYAFTQNQLSQAQSAEAAGAYGKALNSYATVESVAGNPVGRILLGDLNDRAVTGTAETHFNWGVQLKQQGQFAQSQAQLEAVVQSGLADWEARGNAGLADLFLAWGGTLVAKQQFQAAIEKYKQVSNYDPAGNLSTSTSNALADAYAGYAAWYIAQQPPDYPNALTWYETLLKDYPDSAQAKAVEATALPQTLYNAGLAFVKQMRYQQARDAMTELVQKYPTTSWAAQANTALQAPQPLTGQLVVSDQNPAPVPNRLVRIATHWRIVKAHTYDDSGGQIYSTTTDAQGNFTVTMPPGQNYLITWWDPSRSTFVTTFVSDSVPVNLVTINPLEPAHTRVATS
ncbi:MAG TPA: tetratricopeptide repeat protein [Candidatus Dormibacteraeota bacterium]